MSTQTYVACWVVFKVFVVSSDSAGSFLADKITGCLEKDYNTVVETLAIKELLLDFGLELKKLRDEFY